jgi:hypothetical protein
VGDISGDLEVDSSDFIQFRKAFGSELGYPNYNDRADFADPIGTIDSSDFIIFRQNFGSTCP